MNQRQLAEMLQCTPRNITGLVDALEETGLVQRQSHPTDRRATLVTLTKTGQAAADSWDTESQALAARLFDGLDLDELAQLASSLDHILERLGVAIVGTRSCTRVWIRSPGRSCAGGIRPEPPGKKQSS